QELSTLYQAFTQGQVSPLRALPIQYADFGRWQQSHLQGELLEKELGYWRQQLADIPPCLELPTDHPRPAISSSNGAIYTHVLPPELSDRLKTFSKHSGVTLFVTLLATFQILLFRYSGQEDLVVGTPVAGRDRVEFEPLIGVLINSLVLRVSLADQPTFSDVLQQVQQTVAEALSHQSLPFEKVVQDLQPERDLSRSPIFQVLFQLRNFPHNSVKETDLIIKEYYFDSGIMVPVDLELEIRDEPEGLICDFRYNTDLFDQSTIERMAGHFQTILDRGSIDSTQRVTELPLLTKAEQHQLLVEWNNTQTKYCEEQYIHQLFEQQVEKTPNSIAIKFEQQQLTYKDLNQKANQLAHYLQKLGIKPEVLVGICVDRSLEMIVGILGVLKAGGAYIPLDPSYPQRQLNTIVSDAQPVIILTKSQYQASLISMNVPLVYLDQDWSTISQSPGDNLAHLGDRNRLAYIIYTSGSTGKPKGVAIEHPSLINFSRAAVQSYELTGCDRILQFASINFDTSVEEIYPCLISGGTLVLRTDDMLSSVRQFLQTCREWRLTVLDLPTVYWQQIVTELAIGNVTLPEQLKLVIVGGERVSPESMQTWQTYVGNRPQLLNTYGPTEATVVATTYPITATTTINNEVPIGKAIANLQTYILDSCLQPLPIGIPGELHIGGAGLARGYLNRPDLTVEKFISHPFSNRPEAKLYKTGDLARYLPDGNIEFLGRIDHQVKIRGFRIELGEIETALLRHPQVQQAVVVADEDESDKRLVAYLVTTSSLNTTQVQRFLKQQLPGYMVPSVFVLLEALPLTPNGKVDRRALPKPDLTQRAIETAFVAPRTPIEAQLSQIWSKLLKLEQVGIHDNFFELGGHSLLAVQLFSQIETVLQKQLPISVLFKAPTISELATFIEAEPLSEIWSPLVEIQTGGSRPPLFCVHGGGFNVLIYRDVAQGLGSEYPVYGLQARGLQKNEPLVNRLEDMASDYIHEIRRVQPQGPYFLAGLSNGGKIALEMAQQLQVQGEEVGLVAMFDTYAPDGLTLLEPLPRFVSSVKYVLRYSLPQLVRKRLKSKPKANSAQVGQKDVKPQTSTPKNGVSRQLQTASKTQKTRITQFQLSLSQLRLKDSMNIISQYVLEHSPWSFIKVQDQLIEFDDSISIRLKELAQSYQKAYKTYNPKPYMGKIILFRAIETPPGFKKATDSGWGKFALGGVEVYNIPGHHTSIMRSPVLTTYLKHCIDKSIVATNEHKKSTGLGFE
ncbi:MAG: amino acid adenylation domain-containing protein, partial [Cyanobacteriota bacterium]|nr:amino acid adenylation domain-containing protein [Cyanobacteriota bacterium]